jgi:hypothetical protein
MPKLSRNTALQIGLKAVNNISGPNSIIPTLLVFRSYPRILETNVPALTIAARQLAIRKAIAKVIKIRAKTSVNTTLNSRNGPDTSVLRKLGIRD